MDNPIRPMNAPAPAPVSSPTPEMKSVPQMTSMEAKKGGFLKKLVKVFILLVLLAAAAYGGYWWRDRNAKSESKSQKDKISSLESEVSSLKSAAESVDTSAVPTTDQLNNIKDSISSGNTAALEGYMADSVTVILAASEGLGARTPAQAVSDVDYVISLGATWDFDLSSDVLADYAAGDYGSYFPEGALVGKSSENKVISFQFDKNAKIETIFMSSDADLLL